MTTGTPSPVPYPVERARPITRRLAADAAGAHEAHGCGGTTPGRYATIILEPDGPLPGCMVVSASQRLRVLNRMVAVLHGRTRNARVGFAGVRAQLLPVGATLVFGQPVATYLAVGEHFLYYDTQDSRLDIWLK